MVCKVREVGCPSESVEKERRRCCCRAHVLAGRCRESARIACCPVSAPRASGDKRSLCRFRICCKKTAVAKISTALSRARLLTQKSIIAGEHDRTELHAAGKTTVILSAFFLMAEWVLLCFLCAPARAAARSFESGVVFAGGN